MDGGGLFDPIGREPGGRPRTSLTSPVVVVAGAALVGLAALIVIAAWRDDGDRGEPRATSTIEHVAAPEKPTAPTVPHPAPTSASAPTATAPVADGSVPIASPGLPPARGDQDVEIQNGVRIIRPRRDATSAGGLTVKVPAAAAP